MIIKTALWMGVIATSLFAFNSTAEAQSFVHRHRLVDDIEELHHAVEYLHEEVHHHRDFSPLTEATHHLVDTVEHFCETAQRHGSLSHLRRDFREVNDEMKHVQYELRRIYLRCHDRHILQAYAKVERLFDRVYYDLYETHCGFIQYRCSLPKPSYGHGHGGHYDHHYHGGGHYNGGYYKSTPHGSIQVKLGNGKPQVKFNVGSFMSF